MNQKELSSPPVKIIEEETEFLVLNKSAGFLVHSPKTSKNKEKSHLQEIKIHESTVVDWLKKNYPEVRQVGDSPEERPGIVHRLDAETSGVLIVAKTQKMFDYLKSQFQTRQVKKTYIALVYGAVKEKGIIDAPIGLKPGTVKRTVRAKRMKMVKEALTEYEPVETYKRTVTEKNKEREECFTLLRVTPKTGRTHQIRVHLSSIHHPIVGDPLYGPKKNPLGLNRQFLHANSIELSLPNGQRMRFEAELPSELQNTIQSLEKKR